MSYFSSATALCTRIRTRDISCVEVMEVHLAQIERVNDKVNALVTLVPEQALKQAHAADKMLAEGADVGVLHGLPIAHKDLADTKGIRTTYGSPLFKDHIPERNILLVERTQAAGAITIGKTNTPEFGAGSQTFNPVFGATRNPYDLQRTCGGSSGGAAVALATGMVPIADGSDMGGSLRNPASFCNVVGFRPTPGLVPNVPVLNSWETLGVLGPMARSVEDVGLLLSAIAGSDPRCPIARTDDPKQFRIPLDTDLKGKKVAWCLDFANLPIDPRVHDVLAPHRQTLTDIGLTLVDEQPDFTGADEAFKVFRAQAFAGLLQPLYNSQRDKLKETVIWNIEQGLTLTAETLNQAAQKRTELFRRVAEFMRDVDYLVLPVSQVPPFDIETEYITEINGVKMDNYIEWMRSCYFISALGNPAISVPAGFTPEGLPIGLQIVGRYGQDLQVLQVAHAFEQATQIGQKQPDIAL